MKLYVITITAIAFSTIGCSYFGSKADPAANAAPAPGKPAVTSGAKIAAGADPREEIIAASKKFLALDHFTANSLISGESEITMKLQYQAPDRFHANMTMGGDGEREFVMIGKDNYVKLAGSWKKFPVTEGNDAMSMRDLFTEKGLKSLTDVIYEGEDTVEGKAAYRYSYKNVTDVEKFPFTSRIWIDSVSGVPLKLVVEYEKGVVKHLTTMYDTSTPVTVEIPNAK